ncbi:hypothetical protein [Limosilactobacillus coleohominis]|nr:hypothetical protein [Limosilactobacillus coleohominis]
MSGEETITKTACDTYKKLKKSVNLNDERIIKIAEIIKILATNINGF